MTLTFVGSITLVVLASTLAVVWLAWQSRSESPHLRKRLEQIEAKLSQDVIPATREIATGIGEVKTEMERSEARLEARISGAADSLGDRIDRAESALRRDVDSTKGALDATASGVRAELVRVEAAIAAGTARVEGNLGGRIDRVEAVLRDVPARGGEPVEEREADRATKERKPRALLKGARRKR